MKHYILVHGAWGGAWEFEEMATLLSADGSRVIAVDLPGHGANKAPISEVTMAAYVAHVTEVINGLDAKVTLVGHSLAGSVISQVAEDIPAKIERLIYVAASLPKSGDTVLGLMESDKDGKLLPNVVFSEDQSYATIRSKDVRELLLHDVVNKERVENLIPHFAMKQSTNPFMVPVELSDERFGTVPKFYIRANMDKVMSISLQDEMIRNWKVEQVFTLDSGHFPLISIAESLYEIISEISQDEPLQKTA